MRADYRETYLGAGLFGHKLLKRFILFWDNRAGNYRQTSLDPIRFIGYLKTNYYSKIQYGISIGERGHDEWCTFKQAHLLYTYTNNRAMNWWNTHAVMQPNKSETRMQLFCDDCGTGQRREQGKALQPSIIYYSQALIQFYLTGHGATTFTQINKERPPQRQGGQTCPVGLYVQGAC